MSFQFNPIGEPESANESSSHGAMQLQVCPHLGLYDDPALVLTEASDSHRCFARTRPSLPGYEHQELYCLRANHVQCPYFSANKQESVAPIPSPFSEPFRSFDNGNSSGPRRRWPALLAVLLGATILGAAALFASDYINNIRIPDSIRAIVGNAVAPATPVITATNEVAVAVVSSEVNSTTVSVEATAAQPAVAPQNTATPIAEVPTAVNGARSEVTNTLAVTGENSLLAGTSISSSEIISAVIPNGAITSTEVISGADIVDATPTPLPGGVIIALTPRLGNIGWWQTNDQARNHLNDSFLYVGKDKGESFISAARFDLTEVPRGADIAHAELRLTGLRDNRFNKNVAGTWIVQLVAENELRNMIRADYLEIYAAPASIILFPQLNAKDMEAGKVNRWELDESARQWLQKQIFDGANTVSIRILSTIDDKEDSLFAWDSGLGPESLGDAPTLVLNLDQPPLTPLPTVTKEVIVATLTPTPENVLTEVAFAATATEMATTIGTYTPAPFDVVTPTPLPRNVETAQAIAVALGELPVVLDTPTPANESTATAVADIATAVARTTGTYTPVPFPYNTPVLVIPSPPAENVATLAARVATETAVATTTISETATPLPYNAVLADFVYATEIPQNKATTQAQSILATAEAQTTGTPTPLAWNAVIITRVPTPRGLSAAPSVASAPAPSDTTPTPTSQPVVDIAELRNKIIYRRAGEKGDETWSFDPATGASAQINNPQAMLEVERRLGLSPDGRIAFAERDSGGGYQIAVRGTDGSVKLITAISGANYDAAWSPNGETIAFVSNNTGDEEIYAISPDGQNLRQLTNSPRFDKHPSWSPDGSKIVFYSTRAGKRQLWIMNADGSNPTPLTGSTVEEFDPVWVR